MRIRILLFSTVLALTSPVALAGDAEVGKAKAEPCMECHYSDDFAGESAGDIVVLIEATKDDSKHKATHELSDADIAAIAAYFALGEPSE